MAERVCTDETFHFCSEGAPEVSKESCEAAESAVLQIGARGRNGKDIVQKNQEKVQRRNIV